MNQCTEVIIDFSTKWHVCESTTPILKSTDNCIVKLLHNPFANEILCKYKKITYKKDILLQLTATNSWLYVIENKQRMVIKCKGREKVVDLTGQGIITFKAFCNVKTNRYLLPITGTSLKTLEVKQPLTLPHGINITTWQHKNSTKIKELQLILDTSFRAHFDETNIELEELEKNLQQTEAQREIRNNTTLYKTQGIMWGTLLLLTIITVTAIGYYFRKKLVKQAREIERITMRRSFQRRIDGVRAPVVEEILKSIKKKKRKQITKKIRAKKAS